MARRQTGVRSSVSFEVKRVVETFAAERAQIAFDVVMATQVTLQQSLERKRFAARATLELTIFASLQYCNHEQTFSQQLYYK